jgi:hypothetical protein
LPSADNPFADGGEPEIWAIVCALAHHLWLTRPVHRRCGPEWEEMNFPQAARWVELAGTSWRDRALCGSPLDGLYVAVYSHAEGVLFDRGEDYRSSPAGVGGLHLW